MSKRGGGRQEEMPTRMLDTGLTNGVELDEVSVDGKLRQAPYSDV